MNTDRDNASIELTKKELDYLTGKVQAPEKRLEIVDESGKVIGKYASFRDKVESRAEELCYETDRTVEIFVDGNLDRIAVYKEHIGELTIEI